jgi:hypothetical protein
MSIHEEIVMSTTLSPDSMHRTCSTDSGVRSLGWAMLPCDDSRQCREGDCCVGSQCRPLLHRKHSMQYHLREAINRRSSGKTLLILLVTVLLCAYHDPFQSSGLIVRAEKDSNPYPYGENPNNVFKMYWNDAGNIMQDLSKFSSLHIRYHGCVWSECQVDSYDDDGENRDGGT